MECFPSAPRKRYNQVRHEIRSGDILLCSGDSFFSTLIRQATNSVWSHVAFILRVDSIERILVLESVESIGVRTVPLSSYLCDYNGTGKGYPGHLMLARHAEVKEANMAKLSHKAIDYLGYPYHQDEIVRIAAKISMQSLGINILKSEPAHRAFICSEYAYTCFNSIGVHIEYNNAGFIAPADFARNKHVHPICYLEHEAERSAILTHEAEKMRA